MKSIIHKLMIISGIVSFLVFLSCTGDDNQDQISRVLQDPDGLDIDLVWNPPGVDLDLFIEAVDTDDSEFSVGTGNSETVDLNTSYPDGTYLVGVEFSGGNDNATYSLRALEKNGDDNAIEVNGTIGPNTNTLIDREVFTIIKDGSSFEVRN